MRNFSCELTASSHLSKKFSTACEQVKRRKKMQEIFMSALQKGTHPRRCQKREGLLFEFSVRDSLRVIGLSSSLVHLSVAHGEPRLRQKTRRKKNFVGCLFFIRQIRGLKFGSKNLVKSVRNLWDRCFQWGCMLGDILHVALQDHFCDFRLWQLQHLSKHAEHKKIFCRTFCEFLWTWKP